MLTFTENEVELFEKIFHLDDDRDAWILRTVGSLDFSDGINTYNERVTYDIDSHLVSKYVHDKAIYIPLTWRPRRAFLEFDCLSNAGSSLQLVELSVREKYSAWYFWRKCMDLHLIDLDDISDCLIKHLDEYIKKGKLDHIFTCSSRDQSRWEKIAADPEIKLILNKIGYLQPLILRTTKKDDVSIVKVTERKTLFKPQRRKFSDLIFGRIVGIVESGNYNSTKIMAPKDVRINSIEGVVRHAGERSSKISSELFGAGSWAYCTTKNNGIYSVWRLTFTGRSPIFAVPALRALILGWFAVSFWGLLGVNADSGASVLNSFSMAVVGSIFLYYIKLFDFRESHSPQFRWANMLQRRALTIGYVVTLLFPFTLHLMDRLYFLFASLWFWSSIPRIMTLDSANTVVRWLFFVILTVLIVDFFLVRRSDNLASENT